MRSNQRPFVGGLWDIKSLTIAEIYNIDAVAAWKTKWNKDEHDKFNILSRSVVENQIEPCHNVDLERVVIVEVCIHVYTVHHILSEFRF